MSCRYCNRPDWITTWCDDCMSGMTDREVIRWIENRLRRLHDLLLRASDEDGVSPDEVQDALNDLLVFIEDATASNPQEVA